MRFGLLVCRQYACFGDDATVGMSYTGSTPALGAGRPGSIPGIPTVVLSERLRACFKSPYSTAISKFWLQNIQISSCYLSGSTPQSSCFSLKILKFRDERDF